MSVGDARIVRTYSGPLALLSVVESPSAPFRNAPGQMEYARILTVGRKCVWLLGDSGRLFAVGLQGQRRFRAGHGVWGSMSDWAVDPTSDDLTYVTSKGHVYRVDAKTGKATQVVDPRASRRSR